MTVEDLLALLEDAARDSRKSYMVWGSGSSPVARELDKLIQELDGAVAVWMVDGEGAWKIIAIEE